MGFETFRVELRGGAATYAQAEETVRQHPHARPDHDSIASLGSAYYTLEDGIHVIEVEVAASPVRVSCRFTLYHPPSIDTAFMALVHELMARLGMEVKICDDIPPDHSQWFSGTQFSEFAEIVSSSIARRRAEWIANFGTVLLPAKTSEVYEKVILPRCTPIVG